MPLAHPLIDQPARLPLLCFVLLLVIILATAFGLRHVARDAVLTEFHTGLQRTGEQATELLRLMQERGLDRDEQIAQLRLLRETQLLEVALVLDRQERLLLSTSGDPAGLQVSQLLVDPRLCDRARAAKVGILEQARDGFKQPILRYYQQVPSVADGAVLCLQRRDTAVPMLAMIDTVGLVGTLLAATIAGLFCVGFWLFLRQRAQLAAHARMAESLDHVGKISALIAHEVKNPLNTARVAAESLACSRELDQEDRTLLAVIDRCLRRSTRELEGLLGAVRSIPMRLVPAPIAPLLEELHDEIAQRAAAAGVTLQWQANGHCHCHIDPGRLQQAIANLLYNAIEAVTPGRGTVGLTASCSALSLRIDVSDDGPGIDPTIRQRLFTPFATTKAQGMGLGLAGSRRTVEAMGGDLRLLTAGDGDEPTCFSIVLPIAGAAEREEATA